MVSAARLHSLHLLFKWANGQRNPSVINILSFNDDDHEKNGGVISGLLLYWEEKINNGTFLAILN